MADDDKSGAPNSADKSDETKAKQNTPGSAESKGPVELDHGKPSEASEKEVEAEEKVKNDPWGSTPAQMRDKHDELVDPEKVDPISTGLVGDQLRGTTRLDPMEPQADEALAEKHGVSGGTNAPA